MLRRASGFTLLEILVVLVIMSIVAGIAVLRIGHNENKELEAFVRDLTQTLTLAEEQALLQPATLGLVLTAHSYGFYEYRQNGRQASWEPLHDRELGLHDIPKDLELSLKIDNQPQSLALQEGQSPSLFVSTNGTITAFTLLVGKKNKAARYQVIGHSDGSITSAVYQG